jgi:hypothetical protein
MARLNSTHRQALQRMAYILELLENGKPLKKVEGNAVADGWGTFPFPVPPQQFTPRRAARVTIMQTREAAVHDEQGYSPPTYELAGQFLMTPQRANGVVLDNWGFTRALEHYIQFYLKENRERARAKKPLLELVFHDFYRHQHWVVVPTLVPEGSLDSSHPTVERYQLNLAAVRKADSPPRLVNPSKADLQRDALTMLLAKCPHYSHK